MTDAKHLRCLLCGRPDEIFQHEAAYEKARTNPNYRHVCRICSGQTGREAQTVTGLTLELLDALDRKLSYNPGRSS